MLPEHLRDEVERNYQHLRAAIEERQYEDAEQLLAEQRRLLSDASLADAEAQALVLEGQQLIHWALTMTRLQKAHTEGKLATSQRTKRAASGYHHPAGPSTVLNTQG